ncbi:MAG TPA: hypothetical protein ENI96_09945 [Sedimenticola thiotaurini]|uniref:Uncharacterized protein n=1 Tax=Sedimenticola thiotaurini TaxID=1543721 RepID=A0A831RPJ0_9GAMM|nr:hypothetical protein [Sedimenticola thiotaurini]
MNEHDIAKAVEQAIAAFDPKRWEKEIHREYCARSAQFFRHLLTVAPLTCTDHIEAVERAAELGMEVHWCHYRRVADVALQGTVLEGVALARSRRKGGEAKAEKAKSDPERLDWRRRAQGLWAEDPGLSVNRVGEIIHAARGYQEGRYPSVSTIRRAIKDLKP